MNWADSAKESKSTHTVMLMPAQYGSVEQCAKEARRISVGFSNMQRQLRQQVEKQCRNAGYDPPLVTPYEDVMCRSYRLSDGTGYKVIFLYIKSEQALGMYLNTDGTSALDTWRLDEQERQIAEVSAQMREDARREREKAQPEPESAATAQQRADLEEHKRLMADPNAVDLSDW
jgi:hypothetical protein